jgi:hypothetical protein
VRAKRGQNTVSQDQKPILRQIRRAGYHAGTARATAVDA